MTLQSINHKNYLSYQTATKLLTEKEDKKTTPLKEAATYTMSERAKKVLEHLKADENQRENQNIEEAPAESGEVIPENEELETKEDIPPLSERDREKLEKLFQSYSASLMAWEVAESHAAQAERYAEYVAEEQAKLKKCMEIFRNLKGGGRVPAMDEAYLQKTNFCLYHLAMTARMLEELKDKEEESVLDEEDIIEMRGEVENSEPTYTGAEIEPSPQLDLLRAIGDVLIEEKPLSSLEGMMDLSNFDGYQSAQSDGGQKITAKSGKISGGVASSGKSKGSFVSSGTPSVS